MQLYCSCQVRLRRTKYPLLSEILPCWSDAGNISAYSESRHTPVSLERQEQMSSLKRPRCSYLGRLCPKLHQNLRDTPVHLKADSRRGLRETFSTSASRLGTPCMSAPEAREQITGSSDSAASLMISPQSTRSMRYTITSCWSAHSTHSREPSPPQG